ncbi:STAS-like domain-containing protein [Cronobacter turicensis]
MKTINYKLPSGDLASRRLAITERHKLESHLNSGERVRLDLSNVLSLSESYSDEIFGVLVVKLGADKVLAGVKIENASPAILKSIAKVILRRSNEVAAYKSRASEVKGYSAGTCWASA